MAVVVEKKEILLTDREGRKKEGVFRSVFGAAAGGWLESGGRAFSEAD